MLHLFKALIAAYRRHMTELNAKMSEFDRNFELPSLPYRHPRA
ncbi:MAG TPA: hypothetical protein VKP60_02465 [Magnetospirillaceae bacterium]|nr:hypothetical protein [Magnetospirillaceae bacterium]